MDEYLIQETTLSELANAIREKNKTSTPITAAEMGELIQNIPDEYILTNDESLLLEGTITNYFNSKATQVRSYSFYSNSIIK